MENGKREGVESSSDSPMIKVKVYHDIYQHEVVVPARSTFGDLKKALVHITGLEPHEQRLLFRGKRREDDECFHTVGVKDMSKVVLLEDLASKELKLEKTKMNESISKACEAVVCVRSEVDKLEEKLSLLELDVNNGINVPEKEFVVLSELLMRQLLKLDTIEADGEAKTQRKIEVRRVQNLVDSLDALKARNSSSSSSGSSSSNAVSVQTQ